jgi:hypothetical protein
MVDYQGDDIEQDASGEGGEVVEIIEVRQVEGPYVIQALPAARAERTPEGTGDDALLQRSPSRFDHSRQLCECDAKFPVEHARGLLEGSFRALEEGSESRSGGIANDEGEQGGEGLDIDRRHGFRLMWDLLKISWCSKVLKGSQTARNIPKRDGSREREDRV